MTDTPQRPRSEKAPGKVDMRAWPAMSSGSVDLTLEAKDVRLITRYGVRHHLGPVVATSTFTAFGSEPAPVVLEEAPSQAWRPASAATLHQSGPWHLWFFAEGSASDDVVAGLAHIRAELRAQTTASQAPVGVITAVGGVVVRLDREMRTLDVVHTPARAAAAPDPLTVVSKQGRISAAMVGDPVYVEATFAITSDDPDLDLALRDVC